MSEDLAVQKMDKFTEGLRELMMAVVEQCAQAVMDIPTTTEDATTFKFRAAAEIRSLNDPAPVTNGQQQSEAT